MHTMKGCRWMWLTRMYASANTDKKYLCPLSFTRSAWQDCKQTIKNKTNVFDTNLLLLLLSNLALWYSKLLTTLWRNLSREGRFSILLYMYVAMHMCSITCRSKITSNCGKNRNVYTNCWMSVCCSFHHILKSSVNYNWRDTGQQGIYLFYIIKKQKNVNDVCPPIDHRYEPGTIWE